MSKDSGGVIEVLERSREYFNKEINRASEHALLSLLNAEEYEFLKVLSVEAVYLQFLCRLHQEFLGILLDHLRNGGTADDIMKEGHVKYLLQALDRYLEKSKAA